MDFSIPSNLVPPTNQLRDSGEEPCYKWLNSPDGSDEGLNIGNLAGGIGLGTDSPLDSIFWKSNYVALNLPQLSDNYSPHLQQQDADQLHQSFSSGSMSPPSSETPQLQLLLLQLPQMSEDELQLRKKAQNRALQRLFRERKESKLKQLSDQLHKTESEKTLMQKELERLKEQNIVLATENQTLLKAGYSKSDPLHLPLLNLTTLATPVIGNPCPTEVAKQQDQCLFPQGKSQFIDTMVVNTHHDIEKAHKFDSLVYTDNDNGEEVLTVGAVWDYLYKLNTENEDLDLDVTKIMRFLKGKEICHGYGPGYPINYIKELILLAEQE